MGVVRTPAAVGTRRAVRAARRGAPVRTV